MSFIKHTNVKFITMAVARMQPLGYASTNRFKSKLAADARQKPCVQNYPGVKEWAARATNTDWEKVLTPEQYFICREGGTEEPFTGINYSNFDEGVYKCVCCSLPLFSSKAKYDSGYGWPSFKWPEEDGVSCNVVKKQDNTPGPVTQVVCTHCDSQLGHLLQDSRDASKDFYCINSEALDFQPK